MKSSHRKGLPEGNSQGSLSGLDIYLYRTHTKMGQNVDHLLGLQPSHCGCVDQIRFLAYLLKTTRLRWHRVVFPPYFCSGEHPHVILSPPLFTLLLALPSSQQIGHHGFQPTRHRSSPNQKALSCALSSGVLGGVT